MPPVSKTDQMTPQLQAAAQTAPQTRGEPPRKSQEIPYFEKTTQPQRGCNLSI